LEALHDFPGTHTHTVSVPAHAAATATEEYPIFYAPFNCKLTNVLYIPAADITGVDTNTTHLNIINRGAAGAGVTELDNVDFVAGVNASKAVPKDMATTDVNLAKGDVIVAQYEKVGTGLALPAGQIVFEYEAR
jgi:hypothetical protein